MAPKKYTWQEVTNEPRGVFRVGDRDFTDQSFTRRERAELIGSLTEEGPTPFIVATLNARKTDPLHVDVTPEWVDAQLNDAAIERVFVRLAELVGVQLEPRA